MMDEWAITLITTLLSGGLIFAIVAAIKGVAEKRKLESEAQAVGAKTPVEVESIQMASMVSALQGAREINNDLRNDNQQLRDDFKELKQAVEDSNTERRADSNRVHAEIDGLRRALRAAQLYIEIWMEWGSRVAPDEPQPEPPPGYKNI